MPEPGNLEAWGTARRPTRAWRTRAWTGRPRIEWMLICTAPTDSGCFKLWYTVHIRYGVAFYFDLPD